MTKIKTILPYIWQPLMAFGIMLGVLFCMSLFSKSIVLGAVGATSLASTTLIAFANPLGPMAKNENIIGGYALGMLFGVVMRFGAVYCTHHVHVDPLLTFEFFAALAVAFAIGTMAALRLLHPPAVGVTVGLVIEAWDIHSIFVVGGALISIIVVRMLFKPIIKPLL